jgi:predicted ATPase/class 3 adenylate cyclase/DNA-binding SARP family transcriptional activator
MAIFRILGPVKAHAGGPELALGGHRQLSLLAFLLVNPNRAVSADTLTDAIWGPDRPAGDNRLQMAITRLRKALEPLNPPDGPRLRTVSGGYLLALGAEELDAEIFAEGVRAGRAALRDGDPDLAVGHLNTALALWRGPPLAEVAFESFALPEIRRLDELRLAALETRVDARLQLGEHREVIGELEALVAEHPTREHLAGLLMLALYRAGRQADALGRYQNARAHLAQELGLEPGPALRALQTQILDHAPELEPAPRQAANGPPTSLTGTPAGDTSDDTQRRNARTPPAGTVTFMFTDIEGSTRAWEERPDSMRAALRRHDRLVRDAVTAGEGYVFKTVGDAFCVAFSDAVAAISSAVETQRRLSAERWPTEAPLRVRMALHSGACEEREGDYFGPAVNRVARLVSLAHGGQVLVSAATAALAADVLPAGVSLRDLGEHLLKDVGRRERVAQVIADGVRADFPPLRTINGGEARHNLPAQLTRFVGRDRELAEVQAALRQARVVTLVGPGGVGKTRLALEAATRQVGAWKDGVWLAELAPVSEEGSIGRAIAAALGVRERADHSELEAVIDVLRSYDAVLVLDNCEHVIEAAANAALALARSCAGVVIVATSRECLAIEGEQVVRVSPLGVPEPEHADASRLRESDAVALFLDRARLHDPGVVADRASLECVATICRRLDGMPLALELAAARLRGLGATELENRLDDRFRLLTARGRGQPARQRTLAATLDWSFDLLSGPEQLLFTRSTVFSGTFDLDAAESVCAGDGIDRGDIWELLTALVDKSLVEVDMAQVGVRYRLLETMREYGRERLLIDPNAAGALRATHLEHYLAVAEASDSLWKVQAGREFGARLLADSENFESALRTSLELGPDEPGLRLAAALAGFWFSRGLHRKTVSWLTSLLEPPLPPPPTALHGRALFEMGRSLMSLARLPEAGARFYEALAIARAQQDDTRVCQILGQQAFLANLEGDAQRAVALATEGLELARRLDDPALIGWSLTKMADSYETIDFDRTRRLFEEALEIARRAGDETLLLTVLNNSGEAARHVGELDLARERLEECVALGEARDAGHYLTYSKRNLAAVLLRQGEPAAAALLARDALRLAERSGSPLRIAYVFLIQAEVASASGDLTRAAFLHGAADRLFHEARTSPEIVDVAMRDEGQAYLRASIGDEFEREYQAGRTTPREAALAFARQQPGRAAHSVPITS